MRSLSFIFILIMVFAVNQLRAETQHEKKLASYKNNWARLIPNQSKLQFAGSMGMFSAGPGWYYGKQNQWETDWYIGFIPKMAGIDGHVTTTIKQTYTPFRIQFNDCLGFEPLTSGIYINKIFGEYFWNKLPEKYPKKYYFWAVNTRFNIFLGQAVSIKMGDSMLVKELSFYYEFNTNDLYLISAFGNKTNGIKDIVGLSFGIRYRVF